MATTALDLITGALLNINSYSPAETVSAQDAKTCLDVLNDLLDSLSNDSAFVYTQQETLFQWNPGQYEYQIGNPVSPTTFTATLTANSPVLTVIGTVPANLIVGATLTDLQSAIHTGNSIVPAPTTVLAILGNQVTMSASVPSVVSSNPDIITYTIPGDIPMNRPLRFQSGFTRSDTSSYSNNDYTFNFTDFDNYKRELLKNVQGPWPYIASYQPTFPYGTLYVYPAPGANYTAHLFSDLILSEFPNTTSPYSLPQGYTRALKKLLAMELAPIYGKTPSPDLRKQAKESMNLIKELNETPVPVLQYDTALARANATDAGWIINGGFS